MGLFESQEGRNRRLFKDAYQTLKKHFSSNLDYMPRGEERFAIYSALLIGSHHIASNIIEKCTCVRELWKKGDSTKSLALVKLFTLHLYFCWRTKLEKEVPLLRGEIIILLSEPRKQLIKDSTHIYFQFKWEYDNKTDFANMANLLLVKACEACGEICVDWDKLTLPIKRIEDLHSSDAILDNRPFVNSSDSSAMINCIQTGVEKMFTWYSDIAKELEARGTPVNQRTLLM